MFCDIKQRPSSAYICGVKIQQMIRNSFLRLTTILLLCGSGTFSANAQGGKIVPVSADSLRYPQEKHLANIRQLTFGGDNAEAYWSFDSRKLVFQATREEWNASCDQIFVIDTRKPGKPNAIPDLVSTGKGRTTCAYFMPGNKSILYASTHMGNESCPHVPPRRDDGKYVWPIYPDYDIYVADLKGKIKRQLTTNPGYDAEATVSPKGDKIVFTSLRSGDLELYTMNIDGSDVKQLTSQLGYDGGAFFSPDGSKIVFRSSSANNPKQKWRNIKASSLKDL